MGHLLMGVSPAIAMEEGVIEIEGPDYQQFNPQAFLNAGMRNLACNTSTDSAMLSPQSSITR